MNYHKLLFIFLVAFTVAIYPASDYSPNTQTPRCSTPNACSDLNNGCTCFCSHICEQRDKKPDEDNPIFVADDPEGHYCYCKPWDLENYEANCKLKNTVKP